MEMWLPPRNEDVAKDSQISGPSVCLKTKGMRRINSGVSTNLLQHQLVSPNMPTWTVTWCFFGTAGHVFFSKSFKTYFFPKQHQKVWFDACFVWWFWWFHPSPKINRSTTSQLAAIWPRVSEVEFGRCGPLEIVGNWAGAGIKFAHFHSALGKSQKW